MEVAPKTQPIWKIEDKTDEEMEHFEFNNNSFVVDIRMPRMEKNKI